TESHLIVGLHRAIVGAPVGVELVGAVAVGAAPHDLLVATPGPGRIARGADRVVVAMVPIGDPFIHVARHVERAVGALARGVGVHRLALLATVVVVGPRARRLPLAPGKLGAL